MNRIEREFDTRLKAFGEDIDFCIRYFYQWLALFEVIKDNKKVLEAGHKFPDTWNTIIDAHLMAYFFTLSRIFDGNSLSNPSKIIEQAKEHEIFSKKSLKERRRLPNKDADQWLSDYIEKAYEPTRRDFQRWEGYIYKYRIKYEKYNNIRNRVFAHKIYVEKEDIDKLFKGTSIIEVQKIVMFLNKLYVALLGLYHNSDKPILKPVRYSIRSILKKRRSRTYIYIPQERTITDTIDFFKYFSNTDKLIESQEG